jgi:hypothetical protein
MITPVAPSTSNINDRLQCRRQKKAEESGATALSQPDGGGEAFGHQRLDFDDVELPAQLLDRWHSLGKREAAWRFQQRSIQQQMHAGPMAMGPNPVGGEPRSKQPQG